MSLPVVTNENYFSLEVQMAYMGASQFKAFQKCEAAALAELEGRYIRPKTTALLVGSYVDAYFEGTLDRFRDENQEIFKKDGSLKADYIQAERVIARMERDPLYLGLMSGKRQTIRIGEIAGVPYKIKIDSLLDDHACRVIADHFPGARAALGFCDGAIVDQKVMSSLEPVWSDDEYGRVPFVRAWGYDTQGAIYQAIEGHMLPFILAVGTKEDEPDLAAIYIPDQELAAKLEEVEQFSPRYHAIKNHEIEPIGCGKCPYCRSQKVLTEIVDFRTIGGKQRD